MNKKWLSLGCAAALCLGLAACGAPVPGGNGDADASAPVSRADAASSEDGAATSEATLTVTGKKTGTTTARSTAERTTRYSAPQPVNRMTSGFANGYGAFALRLIQQTQRTGQNGFVSPASVYLALAMTANGAAGNTQEQMLSLLGAKDAAALNKGSRDLQSLLAGGYQLANGIWLNQAFTSEVQPAFLKANDTYFHAGVERIAFSNDAIPGINDWVADKTAGRITDLVKPPLSSDDLMLLINTLLYEGKWEDPFLLRSTSDGVFHGPEGNQSLPMMAQTLSNAVWYEDDAIEATRLPFADHRTAMVLVLPKKTGAVALTEWIAGLKPADLCELIAAEGRCDRLHLTLPRFTVSYKENLKDTLVKLGMTDAFDSLAADFSRMVKPTGPLRPYIDIVQHNTALEVNEAGVMAAAATDVQMKAGAALPDSLEEHTLRLDRPFFCALVDEPTGAVIFGGAVCLPEALETET